MKLAVPFLFLAICPAVCHVAFGASTGMVEGDPHSTVRVEMYEDLQCGDSAFFDNMLVQKLLPKYGGRVAFVHRDFPLGKHDWARLAAIASRWVYEQNHELGLDFRRQVLAEQDNISMKNLNSWLAEYAVRNGLDPKAIVNSLNDIRLSAMVDQDLVSGKALGITRVPTVFIGGQSFVETIIYDDVAAVLDEALK